jgi:hypothetical protein
MPEVVKEYTTNMRGVDVMDQHIETLNVKQKSNKWWKPIFYHVIEITLNNAFILFSKSKQKECRYEFKRNLIEQLLENKPRRETEEILYFDLYKLHTTEKADDKQRCKYCQKQVKKRCKECSIIKHKEINLHPECSIKYHIFKKIYK